MGVLCNRRDLVIGIPFKKTVTFHRVIFCAKLQEHLYNLTVFINISAQLDFVQLGFFTFIEPHCHSPPLFRFATFLPKN